MRVQKIMSTDVVAKAARNAGQATAGSRKKKAAGAAAAVKAGRKTAAPVATISGRLTPSLGRQRKRQPDSARRAPMPATSRRLEKDAGGRNASTLGPAYIRDVGGLLDAADKDYLRRKLGRKLGKFGTTVVRASVRVEDMNGPRGGVDNRCVIKVVLNGLPSVIVDERHHALQAAMDQALDRVERAVRQALQRQRKKPLRSKTSAGGRANVRDLKRA